MGWMQIGWEQFDWEQFDWGRIAPFPCRSGVWDGSLFAYRCAAAPWHATMPFCAGRHVWPRVFSGGGHRPRRPCRPLCPHRCWPGLQPVFLRGFGVMPPWVLRHRPARQNRFCPPFPQTRHAILQLQHFCGCRSGFWPRPVAVRRLAFQRRQPGPPHRKLRSNRGLFLPCRRIPPTFDQHMTQPDKA